MQIIITKTFKKDFFEIFVSQKLLEVFVNKIKNTNLIFLEKNLLKFKFYISSLSIRGVVFININWNYFPIIIAKKSDKNIWENLVLNKYTRDLIDNKLLKIQKDLKNKDFEIF